MYEFTRLHPLSKDYNEIPQANPTNHSTPLKIINLSSRGYSTEETVLIFFFVVNGNMADVHHENDRYSAYFDCAPSEHRRSQSIRK